MGIFARLKMGWNLSKDSFLVLKRQPELALFPLISGIAGLLYIALLFGGSFVAGLFDAQSTGFAVLFLFYLGTAFIAAYFNAALVYSAREAFEGREPTLKSGLAEAWKHKGPLFAWAIISAVVGMIMRAIEQQDNLLADVAALLFSVAWSIITYFIIPVIVFEDVSVTEMFKRSGETFKNTWGETAGANFGVGLVSLLFVVVGIVIAVGVTFLLSSAVGSGGFVVGAVIGAVIVLAMFLFASALGAIAKTALYVYATEGQRPSEFENVDFDRGAN
ncbi:DUF6159 family protein [Halorientalis salina]|uniref:DUF6159 family protein n=1 Tax=Halorientalis salina TaxID=2932266 RepID=UPI0010AC7EA7|nr:DUF6159 family protein [Halorientalis salina]